MDAVKIRRIDLDEESTPTVLQVQMSVDEAIYLATFTGKQTGTAANEIWPGRGADLNSEIYFCLTGEFFNRFWDDGVADARKGVGAL